MWYYYCYCDAEVCHITTFTYNKQIISYSRDNDQFSVKLVQKVHILNKLKISQLYICKKWHKLYLMANYLWAHHQHSLNIIISNVI